MELVFLGTGAGVPAKERNVSSAALVMPEHQGEMWLFDCGEATQQQILRTKVTLPKVKHIFISHMHGDHIFGLPGLLGSRSFQVKDEPLTIYGPKGIKRFVQEALRSSNTHLQYPLEIIEVEDGAGYEIGAMTVTVRRLEHGIPCYGYRVSEADKPGTLLVDKLQAEGVEPGPIYKQFKEQATVTLADGRTLNSADFIGDAKKGKHLAVIGDTRLCDAASELARDVDVLVHEATFMDHQAEAARQFHHSTAKQAAETAKAAGAASLILTHISSRYKDSSQDLLVEAQASFANSYLAEDLWSYTF
ncbi:ribonuclease Z [Tuberibacillus sp. Marseille-P3662]|uniref:ribonuclease Z n=1 Tax=Tuberibacillus sp. Marseille-P3662 TaxID=1965358 RepID=UPI000A1C9377|nr:ribonuclease Z [Tuberibacillus sp. Marseille-P3662]